MNWARTDIFDRVVNKRKMRSPGRSRWRVLTAQQSSVRPCNCSRNHLPLFQNELGGESMRLGVPRCSGLRRYGVGCALALN